MNFLKFLEMLNEDIKNGKIGFGIREKDSNKLLHTFSIFHFYTELKKFKETEKNVENLNSGKWFLTDEYEIDGKRLFSVFGKSEKISVKHDDIDFEKPLKLRH